MNGQDMLNETAIIRRGAESYFRNLGLGTRLCGSSNCEGSDVLVLIAQFTFLIEVSQR